MNTTKILLVTGEDDYPVLSFENKFKGVFVRDIINNIKDYESEDGDWTLSVREFRGVIDPTFITFIRDKIQDHDHKKSVNFYTEDNVI